jgi:hypothetical protein
VLMLYTFEYKGEQYDVAYVWWYDTLEADATTCPSVQRCYHQVGGRPAPHCQVVDLGDILYRTHLIPKSQEGSWGISNFYFRENRFLFSVS